MVDGRSRWASSNCWCLLNETDVHLYDESNLSFCSSSLSLFFLSLFFSVVRVIIFIWSGARTIKLWRSLFQNTTHTCAMIVSAIHAYMANIRQALLFSPRFYWCNPIYSFLSHRVLVACSSHTILLYAVFSFYVCMYLHEFFFFSSLSIARCTQYSVWPTYTSPNREKSNVESRKNTTQHRNNREEYKPVTTEKKKKKKNQNGREYIGGLTSISKQFVFFGRTTEHNYYQIRTINIDDERLLQ